MTDSPDLPDLATLRQMRRQGKPLKEIAEALGLTPAVVWERLSQDEDGAQGDAGDGGSRRTVEEMTGWVIEPRHRNTAAMRRLATFNRMEQGLGVEATRREDLMGWVRRMDSASAVLDYHPEAPPNDECRTGGFFVRGQGAGDEFFFRRHG